MTMQESPIVKRSSSSLLTEDDDPNGGVFVEENCSGSTSSPENPLFGTFKAQQQEELVSTSSKVVGVVPSTTKAAAAAAATTNASVESSSSSFPDDFHASPEPLLEKTHPPPAGSTTTGGVVPSDDHQHQYHLLRQIREDEVSNEDPDDSYSLQSSSSSEEDPYFQPCFASTQLFYSISKRVFQHEEFAMATWMGFWALLNVTCANYVLSPMRDAVALQVGVHNIPKLTLASSVLAFMSSVPIGWLFEAPDPSRRKVWKKMGLTRGETQGSSLALFFRFFALSLLMYAVGFQLVDWITKHPNNFFAHYWFHHQVEEEEETEQSSSSSLSTLSMIGKAIPYILSQVGNFMYIAFFLVVHLAKLHSISLVWGVTTEAMEYEDVARKQQQEKPKKQTPQPLTEDDYSSSNTKKPKTRLQRLGMVSFGGTLGGIGGSLIASSMANILHLSGLLVVSAFLLEISAELSIELGRIMQKHWEEQQIFKSCQDLTSLDPSMKRSVSLGSMKRVASGNSLYAQQNMKRVASGDSMNASMSAKSLTDLDNHNNNSDDDNNNNNNHKPFDTLQANNNNNNHNISTEPPPDDGTFTQRLLRGITTILKSRLLMSIFTYNALFASTSVLLSFQRAELVANRNANGTTVSADTAFLANINMASSMAVFAFQASGLGALIAHRLGPRGSLSAMPAIRLLGVLSLCWWHTKSNGQAPNLILFLALDECTRVVNLAVAKPVRESLWRGLSNEARYEAKPIVDTLANRWGAGSASFCVSVVNKALLWFGLTSAMEDPQMFGFPPVLFLCLIVAMWWAMVSFDLGHIRKRIDMELKKHQ